MIINYADDVVTVLKSDGARSAQRHLVCQQDPDGKAMGFTCHANWTEHDGDRFVIRHQDWTMKCSPDEVERFARDLIDWVNTREMD